MQVSQQFVRIDFDDLLLRFPTEIEPMMDVREIHMRLGHKAILQHLKELASRSLDDGFDEDLAAMGVR